MGSQEKATSSTPELAGYNCIYGQKYHPVISHNSTRRKTRSESKRLKDLASTDPTIYDKINGSRKLNEVIETLEEEIAAEEAAPDQTRGLAGSTRPHSRPLLSSTRDNIDDSYLSEADLNLDVTDVAYPGAVAGPDPHSDPFLTFDESLHAATDELIDSIINELPVEREADLPSPLLECEKPKQIRREIWQVAKSLSTTRSPERLAAALVIVADEAGRESDNTEQDSLITDDSLSNSIELQLPSTPQLSNNMSDVEAAVAEAATAALAAKVDDATDVFLEASLFWDDMGAIDLTKTDKASISSYVAEVETHRQRLTKAFVAVRRLTPEQLPEIGNPDKIKELKTLLAGFRDRAWDQISSRDAVAAIGAAAANIQITAPTGAAETEVNDNQTGHVTEDTRPPPGPPASGGAAGRNGLSAGAAAHRQPPVAAPRLNSGLSGMSSNTEEVVTSRVNSRAPVLLENARYITEQLEQLMNRHPGTNSELEELESLLETVKLEAKELIEDLKELLTLAMSVGLAEAAKELGEAVDDVGAARTSAITSVRGARTELGIPAGAVFSNMNMNIKAPHFKGDYKEKMDFFTFERQFTEYMDALGRRSHGEKLLKLKNDCLSGAAKDCVHIAKTFTEAMTTLREIFAKPEILLALRTKDLLAEGICPEPLIEKQRWFINISNKFRDIREIAETHQIEDFLATSDLSGVIIKNMPKYEKNEFEKAMIRRNEAGIGQRLTRKVIATVLDQFINSTINRLGCTLDYRITNQFGDSQAMMRSLLGDDKKLTKAVVTPSGGPSRRGVHITGVVQGSDSGSVDSANPESSDSATTIMRPTRRQKKRQREAAAATTPNTSINVATADTGDRWEDRPLRVNKSKEPKVMKCKMCKGEHESLVYCPEFRKARVPDRFNFAMRTSSCYRCLRSDAGFILKKKVEWFKEHSPFCSDKHVCRHGKCVDNEGVKQNHILICRHHEEQNKEDHSEFLTTVNMDRIKENKRFFMFVSPDVLSTGAYTTATTTGGPAARTSHSPIYMLQMIPAKNDESMLVFYDTGCVEAAINDRAHSLLDTVAGRPGPVTIDIAGGQRIINPYGYETFELEKTDGTMAKIKSLHMPEITSEFPLWDLAAAWKQVAKHYIHSRAGGGVLPTCPEYIGGVGVDIMLGIEYTSCYPDMVYELPSGLRLYKARLKSAGGHNGILGGPHAAWRAASTAVHQIGARAYFSAEARAVQSLNISLRTKMMLEVPCTPEAVVPAVHVVRMQCTQCHCWEEVLEENLECGENPQVAAVYHSMSAELRRFQDVENLGASIDYRCVVCRNCSDCKNGEMLEHLSLQEEREQKQIEDCVSIDLDKKVIYTKLPFIKDPEEKLKPNQRIAQKVLDSQLRIIAKTPGMKEAVLKAHDKLVTRGHVVKLTDLPLDVQKGVATGAHYFIPWRTVFNLGSLSTPLRMVFDASARTPGGESLNDILARGMNMLGKLLHLLVKFRFGCYAFSADIQMAYNNLKLDPDYYKYHQYLWSENLSSEEQSVVMIVVTAIYGVRPAGNLTLAAFAKIVKIAKDLGGKYTLGAIALEMCSYMDDIFSSHGTKVGRDAAADSLKDVLALGTMSVKAITKSGEPPPDEVTADGTTIGVVGYRWSTVEDTLELDVKPLTLGKTKRGQPGEPIEGDLEEALKVKFTKRVLAGRVASVYDPLGLCTPITSQLKVSMSTVCKMAEGWDSSLPPDLLPQWVHNLQQIRQLAKISVPRNVGVAKDGEFMFDMIVCVDASQNIAAAAVYARTELEPGVFDCNLLIAKSKMSTLVTIPKGELRAASIGAGLAHIVRTNLGPYISREYFCTDSTITLCWLHQDQRPLQLSVRNSVIHIRRLSSLEDWYHVGTNDNPADIATRTVTVDEIVGPSDWFKGRPWMRGVAGDMPLKGIDDVKLSKDDEAAVTAEIRAKPSHSMILTCKVSRLSDRYKLSNYLVDPCSMPWPKYLRVLSIVMRCCKIWRCKSKLYKGDLKANVFSGEEVNVDSVDEDGNVEVKKRIRPIAELLYEDLEAAKRYTFLRTTREVKYFNKKEVYKDLGSFVDGVLIYSGRILDDTTPDNIAGAMLDLGPLSFCKPVLDRYSPVSYAIMLDVHSRINHHGGSRSTYRRSGEVAHILKGLALSEEVRDACNHCKRYKARLLTAALGKIHRNRITPAPPFYFCQTDLVGPWLARCENHPRRNAKFAPVKVWGAVFKCCTTLAVSVETMPDCSASAFVDCYTRFSARYGHPGVMYIDPGSNLKSACSKMTISYADISQTVNGKGVEVKHEICATGSHEGQGLVERSIREVRKVFDAVFKPFELSVMGYATAFAFISNELNNIPLCLGSKYSNLDHLDLITPNRLLLGRNNMRAPIGLVEADVPSMWMETMEDVSKSWWKVWEAEWLVTLVPKPSKWMTGDPDVKVGDVVVFMKGGKEAELGQTPWRTGQVDEAPVSGDGVCRQVTLKYKNHNESVYRYTKRSVRTMAILHREGELDLLGELSQANIDADKHYMIHHCVSSDEQNE